MIKYTVNVLQKTVNELQKSRSDCDFWKSVCILLLEMNQNTIAPLPSSSSSSSPMNQNNTIATPTPIVARKFSSISSNTTVTTNASLSKTPPLPPMKFDLPKFQLNLPILEFDSSTATVHRGVPFHVQNNNVHPGVPFPQQCSSRCSRKRKIKDVTIQVDRCKKKRKL